MSWLFVSRMDLMSDQGSCRSWNSPEFAPAVGIEGWGVVWPFLASDKPVGPQKANRTLFSISLTQNQTWRPNCRQMWFSALPSVFVMCKVCIRSMQTRKLAANINCLVTQPLYDVNFTRTREINRKPLLPEASLGAWLMGSQEEFQTESPSGHSVWSSSSWRR